MRMRHRHENGLLATLAGLMSLRSLDLSGLDIFRTEGLEAALASQRLTNLNLAKNLLKTLPACVIAMTSLVGLDVSRNCLFHALQPGPYLGACLHMQ